MHPRERFLLGLTVIGLGSFAEPQVCRAQGVYEGFDYSPAGSALLGNNGGSGFSGSWASGGFNATNHTNYELGNASLDFNNLATNGNHVTTASLSAIGGLSRSLVSPLGADGTTRYISFLLRPDGTLNAGAFNGFFGVYLASSTGNDLYIGKPGSGSINNFVLEQRGGTSQFASNTTAVVNQTYLLVVKAQFLAGNDKFTLYVDPTPGGSEPLNGTVKSDLNVSTINAIDLYSTGAFSLDEIRIGQTFAEVTPAVVPAPSSLAVLLVGMASVSGLALRRRRK